MFYVSRNLAAFYNLRKNSAKLDISRNFLFSQPNFPKKFGLGVYLPCHYLVQCAQCDVL